VPRHDAAARALVREARVLERLAPRLPVPVPLPIWVPSPGAPAAAATPVSPATPASGTSPASRAAGFSLHEQVRGRELTRELWRGLPEAVRDRVARGVGHFLGGLHGLDAGIVRGCSVGAMDHEARLTRLQRRIRGEGALFLPRSLRAKLDTCFQARRTGRLEWVSEPVILHADVSPGHVLVDVDKGTITGIIDWGDVVLGDPARDFIFLYEDWGRDFLDRAMEGYGREPGERLLPRIHLRYLVDQLEWTLGAADDGRTADLDHGIAALRQGLRDFEESAAW
ncbi:MAG TPA: aminoglycoside phosphotransferase family protein, partial [Longimicrobiales bacterium]|nr:aminoglycoside phosphotransferase family protein [Longimicrobiales bacterium]